jgi:hypothetical protein
MRSEVADSWRRSAAAGVDVESTDPAITLPSDALQDHRDAHPLARVYPLLEEVLGRAARECEALLALSDDAGQLLWVSGSRTTLRRAELIGFVEGANWDERLAGTNAPGTALALGRPVVVTGEEHYRVAVRPWNCVASPIHDPLTGAVLGVLDITGGPDVAVPQTLAMVTTAARLAEAELARTVPSRGVHGRVPEAGGDAFQLQCLGRREGLLGRGGRTVALSPRHTEMMVVLAAAPGGLSGEELAALTYPHEVTASTLRVEVNRLRHLVGDDVVGSRPYRLRVPVAGDWHAVQAHLAAGDVASALRTYVGPVLPHSESPRVRDLRAEVEGEVRQAVFRSGRTDLMTVWTRSPWGADDYEMWSALEQRLPATSALQPLVRAQLGRLDAAYGVVSSRARGGGSTGRAQV